GMRQTEDKLYIVKNNIIREYVTIHTATKVNCSTTIGENNYLMGFSHIAHDCKLANNIVTTSLPPTSIRSTWVAP
ncbi:MAG: hypothetical protein R6V85_03325, partial [Polyangia bacterium]